MVSTLQEYYSGKGQALPSVQDRATTYEQQGLGSAKTYIGSAQQNTALLGKLSASNVSTIPGVGTLTVVPKVVPPASGTQDPNTAGLYARTGVTPVPSLTVTPPQATNANNGVYKDANGNVFETGTNRAITQQEFQQKGYNIDHINLKPDQPTVPEFGQPDTQKSAIMSSYDTLNKTLADVEKQLLASQTRTPEEEKLLKDINDKKAGLDAFDLETMQKVEAYAGQGRGQTQNFVAANQQQEQRTRALQRLGLAQDVTNLTNMLSLSEDQRKSMGDVAKTEYDLATKKLDMALGMQDALSKLDDKTKNDARSYLLDVVSFSKGKTFDQLDPATQQQIIHSVANSPITLDMVKTALKTNAGSADSYSIQDVGGRTIRFGFDNQGNVVSKTDLGSASNAQPTQDVFSKAYDSLSAYKKAGYDRATIEKEIENQNSTVVNGKTVPGAIPLEAKTALDQLFPETVNITPEQSSNAPSNSVWWNPLTWGK